MFMLQFCVQHTEDSLCLSDPPLHSRELRYGYAAQLVEGVRTLGSHLVLLQRRQDKDGPITRRLQDRGSTQRIHR